MFGVEIMRGGRYRPAVIHTVLQMPARSMNESSSAISIPRPSGARVPGKLAAIVPGDIGRDYLPGGR